MTKKAIETFRIEITEAPPTEPIEVELVFKPPFVEPSMLQELAHEARRARVQKLLDAIVAEDKKHAKPKKGPVRRARNRVQES